VSSLEFSPPRLRAVVIGFVVLVVAGALLTDPISPERARLAAGPALGQHTFRQVTSTAAFRAGVNEGTRVSSGSLRIDKPVGTTTYAGKRWAFSRWTSGWVSPGHSFTQLIPTWNAVTPAGTFVEVQARVRNSAGRTSGWKVMARWSTRDAAFRRSSGSSQRDSVARAETDTLVASSGVQLTGYQLRVLPMRASSSSATPTLRSVQAVASRPGASLPATSRPAYGARTLAVPRYSQMTHRGQYPQYGGGGQAWCSPTSLSMLLAYQRSLPSPSNYAWVSKKYADPWVDHVARVAYDYGYQGAGNWAFNTAYAANLTHDAFVTRLRNLREAERFIRAGIPLAASITFSRGQLSGAPISSTAGHLVVIAGFTSKGNVVVNDPAAPSNASVRRTYDRGQFERAWLRKSSGTVYVVRDAAHPLPTRYSNRNW
jgi:hypothetical protein